MDELVVAVEPEFGIGLPESYLDAFRVASRANDLTRRVCGPDAFPTPATDILALNREVAGSWAEDCGNVAAPSDYFLIGGDGCGNFFAIDPDDEG